MTATYSIGVRRPLSGGALLFPFLVLLIVGVALCYVGYVLWPRWPVATVSLDAPTLPITVAGVAFNLPPAAIRRPIQRRPGAQERIDLAFLWPSLAPPDPAAKPSAPDGAPDAVKGIERVFVTIAPAGEILPLEARLRTIYPRYTGNPERGPGGLTVLPFRNGTPYQGEDLIYDNERSRLILRCTRNGPRGIPGTCLYERRIGEANLTVRLARDWLDDWQSVAANIDRLIARLEPRASVGK